MPAETGRIAWHVITAELHTGMLTLAFASLVIRLAGVWVTTSNGVWRGLVRLADPTAFLAAIGGLLALIASIVTGLLYTWPVEVLLTSSVVLNKIATTAFATTFWTLFLVVRAFSGARLWDRARLRWLYFVLGTGGFLSLMLVGSTGGHLAGKRSMLDGVLHYLGVNTHLLFVVSPPSPSSSSRRRSGVPSGAGISTAWRGRVRRLPRCRVRSHPGRPSGWRCRRAIREHGCGLGRDLSAVERVLHGDRVPGAASRARAARQVRNGYGSGYPRHPSSLGRGDGAAPSRAPRRVAVRGPAGRRSGLGRCPGSPRRPYRRGQGGGRRTEPETQDLRCAARGAAASRVLPRGAHRRRGPGAARARGIRAPAPARRGLPHPPGFLLWPRRRRTRAVRAHHHPGAHAALHPGSPHGIPPHPA